MTYIKIECPRCSDKIGYMVTFFDDEWFSKQWEHECKNNIMIVPKELYDE